MKRDQLDYVQFDCDFLSKPKIAGIRFKYGAEGLLAYMQVLFALGKATNAEITTDAFHGLMLMSGYSPAKSKEILDYFLSTGVLNLLPSGFLTNSRIIEDQENIRKKRDKWRNDKRKSGGNEVESDEKVSGKCGGSVNTSEHNEHNEVNNKKEDRPKWLDEIKIPDCFPEIETRDALKRWFDICRTKGRNFDEIQAEALFLNGYYLKEKLPEVINLAVQGGWKNIRFDALQKKDGAPITKGAQILQNNIELCKRLEAMEAGKI